MLSNNMQNPQGKPEKNSASKPGNKKSEAVFASDFESPGNKNYQE
jgi:hypothetical protein